MRGLANYLHGPGKANEHVYEGVPGGRVIGGTLGAEGALDGSRWATDMATVMGQRPDVEKPVWHMSLRLPAKDRTLSDAEWRDVAQEMGERMGWAENPWVMVRHGQDHVHVVVSRVGWDGELWHGRNDFWEAQKARQGIEQRMGLSQTATDVNDGRKGDRFRRLKREPLVWCCLVCLLLDAGGRQGGHGGVPQSVGRALQRDDLGVVDDSVDHGRGDGLVSEDFAPAAEGQVADLVDDQQLQSGEFA